MNYGLCGQCRQIIEARNNATKYLLGAWKFSETEERELVGKSFYFFVLFTATLDT